MGGQRLGQDPRAVAEWVWGWGRAVIHFLHGRERLWLYPGPMLFLPCDPGPSPDLSLPLPLPLLNTCSLPTHSTIPSAWLSVSCP